MARYRVLLALALLFACASAGSLGVGLVSVIPVLDSILSPKDAADLPELARRLNAEGPLAGRIPQGWIDALPTGPFKAVVVIVAALGVLTVFGAAANFLHQYLSLTLVQRTSARIRRETFRQVMRLPLREVIRAPGVGASGGSAGGAADMTTRILADTASLESGLTSLVSKALAQVAKGVATFVAALIAEWRITLVALVVGSVLAFVIGKLGRRIKRASKKAMQSGAALYAVALETLQGLRVVKVHTAERYEVGRFHRINKDVMRQMMRVRTARAISSPLVEMLSILILGTLMVVAAKAITDGEVEVNRFLASLAALFAAGASLKPLTGLVNDVQASSASAERLIELLSKPPEPGHDRALPRLARHQRSIEFQGVWLTYAGASEPALRGVDLVIPHGKTVAVVGPNGSGKTSLFSLVPRLYDPDPPTADRPGGRVLIDGRDLREFSVRSVRRQIGVVTQETVLFRGTIRSNIAYGSPGATDDQVRRAAAQARALEFIDGLPKGLDTPVGDQGLTLSGGQRQRLAIARAVLRDPAILILDEATSMIDADSESKIAQALADFTRGRTCLIVAHRLSTVLGADVIVVMDAGRIIDQGTHHELLARCETYGLIARTQLASA